LDIGHLQGANLAGFIRTRTERRRPQRIRHAVEEAAAALDVGLRRDPAGLGVEVDLPGVVQPRRVVQVDLCRPLQPHHAVFGHPPRVGEGGAGVGDRVGVAPRAACWLTTVE
jgi:hypothetical protein